MWRPISSASGLLAVPLKSLKRLSSLRLRVRLRSAAGLASLPLAAVRRPAGLLSALRPYPRRPRAFGPPSGFLSSAVTGNVSASISDYLQAGWLWLFFGYRTSKLGWATRIRTWTSASKGHCPTIRRSPNLSSRSRVSPAQRTTVNAKASRASRPCAAGCGSSARTFTPDLLRQPGLSCFRISAGQVQPESAEPDPDSEA